MPAVPGICYDEPLRKREGVLQHALPEPLRTYAGWVAGAGASGFGPSSTTTGREGLRAG